MQNKVKLAVKSFIGNESYQRIGLLKEHLKIGIYRGLKALNHHSHGLCLNLAEIQKYSVPGRQTFFGYYDVTPFSNDNNLLLAITGPKNNRPPDGNQEIEVGYFDLSNSGKFHHVGRTSTWCWQQGCRLQWFPENEDELIIYNQIANGSLCSVVQSILSKKKCARYEIPIYDIDKKGEKAISLNFARLNRLRPGYGYTNVPDSTLGRKHPRNDGIWLLNLKNGEKQLIISLDELFKTEFLPSMNEAEHYINHLSFSPSGKNFMFFHLWQNTERVNSRLIISDITGENLNVLEDKYITAHYSWYNESNLLVTVYYKNNQQQYRLYNAKTGRYNIIGEGVLTRDGHPSYSPNGSLLLTDTYPDKYGEQHLLVYTTRGNLIELCKFFSPTEFRFKYQSEARCDLHPRWDRAGSSICIDSAHEGSRALYVIKLKDPIMTD